MPAPRNSQNRLVGGSAGEPDYAFHFDSDGQVRIRITRTISRTTFHDESGVDEPYAEEPDCLNPDSSTSSSPPRFTTSNETVGHASTSSNGSPPPNIWTTGFNGSHPAPPPGGSHLGGDPGGEGTMMNPTFEQVRQRLTRLFWCRSPMAPRKRSSKIGQRRP